jgi:iron complex outermembrane receptor protein
VQLLFARGESFEALARAHAADFDGDSLRFKQVGLGTPGRPGFSDCAALSYDVNPGNGCVDQTGFADTRSFTQVFSGSPNLFTRSARGGALQLSGSLAGATVTSLTAYERGDSRRAEDTDGGPSYLFASTLQAESEQWSQDLRVASQRTAAVNWLGGFYLLRERTGYIHARRTGNPILSSAFTPGIPIPEAGARTNMLFGRLEQRDELASAYGQVEVVLRPRVMLTAELRGTTERKSGTQSGGSLADTRAGLPAAAFVDDALLDSLLATATRVPPGFLPLTCPAPFPLTRCWSSSPYGARWNTWSGRIALDARVGQDVLAYASIARGAKGGGVSPVAREILFGAAGRLVEPEFVTTFEIGVKSELLDRTLRVNATVFLNAWRDYQLFLDVPTPVGRSTLLANLPRSRTLGGELETEWAPAPGWLLAAGVGLQRARVRSIGDIGDARVGSRLPGTPDVTFNGRAAREFAIAGGRLTVQAAAAYSGERSFDLLETPTSTEPGYWLFDASARFAFGREQRHEAVLWARNLTATQYCIARQSLAGLGTGDVVGCVPNEARRFVGLSLRTRF